MISINYSEAIKLAKHLSEELANAGELKNHCEANNINYGHVLSYIRSTARLKQPKLIKSFLDSFGYTTQVNKQIIYHFILDENENVEDIDVSKIINTEEEN